MTLRQAGLRWIASLQVEREIDIPVPPGTAAVGLDFGATTTIMPSTGPAIEMPRRLGWYERRMKRLQRDVSRKQRGSRNRRKAVKRLALAAQRASAIRRDTLHKATTELVRGHALIAIEDLAVKNMTASAAGSVSAPGRNVRAKAALNRSILRNAWSAARQMLEYKALWNGVALVAVNPAYTSQACAACGHVAADNRTSQSNFACVACGHAENADRNAAKNILRRAHLELGGCLASTGGHPETHACEGAASPNPRPPPAARGSAVGLSLAGTVSGLGTPGISIP